VIAMLAVAWAGLAAAPFLFAAQRRAAADRSQTLGSPDAPPAGARLHALRRALQRRIRAIPGITTVGRVLSGARRTRRQRRHDDVLATQVAVAVDLLGVGVAAGYTPYLAVELAARWAPPRAAADLDSVVRSCGLGRGFDDALRDLGRVPAWRSLADTLRTSARLGSPVGPALTRLAGEVRADLRRRAEARARTVPVRLCFPLVGCILPAFALLTVVPVVVDGIRG
jgi:Flp pilus assembly protein TadB